MKGLAYKLKSIFLPFLLIGISTIVLYTFLNWLLFVKFNVFSVKEDITNLFIPIFIAIIPLLIWVNPKFKNLKLENKQGKSYGMLYFIIMMIAIAIPTVIAQNIMIAATSKLSALNNINEINSQPATKYYTLKEYYVDKIHAGINSEAEITGKHNENVAFRIYLSLPIYKSVADTTQEPIAWLGKEYSKTVDNPKTDQRRDELYHEFAQNTQALFDQADFQQFTYLTRLGNTDEHDGFNKAIKQAGSDKIVPVLTASDEPFEGGVGDRPIWLGESFLGGALIIFLMLLIPGVKEKTFYPEAKKHEQHTISNEAVNAKAEDFKWHNLFLPSKESFITPILIDLNLIVFIIMVFTGAGLISIQSETLVKWGANYGPLTKDGEWWRLLTSTFLHGGIMHLLMNMYALLFVGLFLEKSLGRGVYLVLYLITGIIASATSLWWHADTVSIGASGAIMGMYGVFLALLLTKIYPPEFNKAFLASTGIFVLFNLTAGMQGGVDNAAHVGGLISGFLLGLLYVPYLKFKTKGTPIPDFIQSTTDEENHAANNN
ncbi:rhomboid family intramembrane serine protease [Taibaiella soli]|uniref:Peptidase S54 rhomboid domain-containing protein n=1 Tax=Taibaiella soli TaxID=1649169 RepID=A0A2W2AEE4_9BACT|nr:rhomboid family intramembrane serine protease [Taibaiella soli]PZF73661.1 hypothetical protein DN068_06595 [Taibaiella soli]